MIRELSLDDVKRLYDKNDIKKFDQKDKKYILTTANDALLVVPQFEYAFIGDETLPAFLLLTDLRQQIGQIIPFADLNASIVEYFCTRYEEKEGVKTYYAIDPCDPKDQPTHIYVREEWSLIDGTDGVDLQRLKGTDVEVLDVGENNYCTSGFCELLIPINNLSRQEVADDYCKRLGRLIEAGDAYYREFERQKPRYFAEIMQQVEVLRQLDCWQLVKVGDEKLILRLVRTDERVTIRFDHVGYSKCAELLDRYRK